MRRAVKVLLLDQLDRVLLLEATEDDDRGPVWFPVGGGLEAGEDLHAAARREVAEETGLRNVHLGAEIWRRRHRYSWRGRAGRRHRLRSLLQTGVPRRPIDIGQ